VSWGFVGAAVATLGAGHLAAYYAGWRPMAGVLKPLPILLLAWQVQSAGGGAAHATLLVAGLLASAVGDVSLVFPNGFLAGLSAFFVAHLFYVAAFAPGIAWSGPAGMVGVVLALAVVGELAHLWPHVARLRVPVVAYVGVLSLMAWCAAARALGPGAPAGAELAAIGAASFVVSDGVLAVNRFSRPFRAAQAVVMVTYYGAQLLIAASTR
jgi:uncharacterized membrane protein YhhN